MLAAAVCVVAALIPVYKESKTSCFSFRSSAILRTTYRTLRIFGIYASRHVLCLDSGESSKSCRDGDKVIRHHCHLDFCTSDRDWHATTPTARTFGRGAGCLSFKQVASKTFPWHFATIFSARHCWEQKENRMGSRKNSKEHEAFKNRYGTPAVARVTIPFELR